MPSVLNMVDRCVVISLARRADRLSAFCALASACDWPFPDPEVFDAVDGRAVPVSHFWRSGGGAYGCQQSHVQVLQRALMDGVQSIAVFEDDATFKRSFGVEVRQLYASVPDDWEALMLGGQHIKKPYSMPSGIVRCVNAQRTHAYIARGAAIRDVCQLFASSRHHIDWDLGPFLGDRNRTYAPDPFLCGQATSKSDINGKLNAGARWSQPLEATPVVWLRCPHEVAVGMRAYGFHYGYWLNADGTDKGLSEIFPEPGVCLTGLDKWLKGIRWECFAMPEEDGICTIWHPNATQECAPKIMRAVQCVEIEAGTLEEALSQAKAIGENVVFKRITPV